MTYDGLEPLGSEFVYEGWLIIDGSPQSSGTFNVGSDGSIVHIDDATVTNAGAATDFVLTIEPAVDPDPAPASTHVLAGSFTNGSADLSLNHPAAFGGDFSSAAGSFILKTPTTETTDDDRSGVWFLDPSGPAPSLTLPTLPDGWAYEGWAVIDGQPVSTGRFLAASGADDFSGFSGPLGGPPFPGEDFIQNAPSGLSFPTDLTGATIVVSVEPSPDDSPAPFALKPLVAQVPADLEAGTSFDLAQGPTNITGVATLAEASSAETAVDQTPAAQTGQGPDFSTHLFGRNEVPAVQSPGFGWSTWQFEDDAVYFRLIVARTEGDVVAAHLHQAKEGRNGPVVAPLDISSTTTLDGGNAQLITGVIRPSDFTADLGGRGIAALRGAIEHESIYVNVHTTAHPGGEVRGQLR